LSNGHTLIDRKHFTRSYTDNLIISYDAVHYHSISLLSLYSRVVLALFNMFWRQSSSSFSAELLTQCLTELISEKSQGVGRGCVVSNLSPLTGRRVGPSNVKILRTPLPQTSHTSKPINGGRVLLYCASKDCQTAISSIPRRSAISHAIDQT